MSDSYYDGDYSVATQTGPTVQSFDPVYRVNLYRKTFHQKSGNFSPLAIGSSGPGSSYLYEETTPRNINADILEWDRLYAEVPPNRVECESFVYNQQETFIPGTENAGKPPLLIEFPIPTTSTITYSYIYTSDPSTISLTKAYRIGLFSAYELTVFYSVGTPRAEGATTILAEDETLVRWRGNIWEKKSRVIPVSALLGTPV